MIKNSGILVVQLVLVLMLFTSCDSNLIYEENKEVSKNGWEFEDIKTFEFEIEDTMSAVNVYINMRTSTDYPYNNVYMYLYSDYPTGESYKDTLEFILAQADGKWLGESSGTIVEFQSLVSSGSRFSRAGTYAFKLQHAMREDLLKEVIDVGMRVEKMEE